jgi:serine protease AprX
VIALMLEANPQLTPAQVRDILQRTATPLPPYYAHEVGAGMLNAQAAVLEAAFSQRRFGQWRGVAYQGQVQFINSAPQVFSGTVTPGSANDSAINFAPDVLRASIQIAWGGLSPNTLALTMLNAQGDKQAPAGVANSSGLTGRRQRSVMDFPSAGTWKARVEHNAGPLGPQSVSSNGAAELANSRYGPQAYTGTIQTTTARYTPMTDLNGLDTASLSEIHQNFRSLVMSSVGQRFRPAFGITRSDLAKALVLGARVPQYLPGQSSYTDVRDKANMLFVESAQAAPNGALFPATNPGGTFLPDSNVDRLTAAIALVRAAGLRQQAESASYTLTYIDAASIPASLRGYVAVAVQNGLIRPNGASFNPQGSFTRLDLSHAMARIATLATQ